MKIYDFQVSGSPAGLGNFPDFLGILEENPNDWFKKGAIDSEKVEALIQSRNKAREEKNFDLADSIRDELLSIGVEIEDKPSGTTWKTI